MGDLLLTCTSPLSRNYTVGFRIAANGETWPQIKVAAAPPSPPAPPPDPPPPPGATGAAAAAADAGAGSCAACRDSGAASGA